MPQPEPTNTPVLIAFINNTLTPYGIHAQRRIAREIEGVELLSINTHLDNSRNWQVDLPQEVTYLDVSGGDRVASANRPSGMLQEARKGSRVIEILQEKKPAAVFLAGYSDLGRLRVMRWCRQQGIPYYIISDSNISDEREKPWWLKCVKGVFLRSIGSSCSGFLMCGSRGMQYLKYYGVPEEKGFISPYEPDYELIRAVDPAEIEAVRQRYGLSTQRRYLIYSGRLAPVKRVDLLLDAFVAIAQQRPEWDLVILGDGELRESLTGRVPPMLAERVKWLGFVGDQAQVSRIYHATDVLVLPSEREPWALVINEAVCTGMAVVASDVVGAAAELVEDGVNGKIFPTGDGNALRAALLEVTAGENTDRMKAASAKMLADWRQQGDPVAGLRSALAAAKVL